VDARPVPCLIGPTGSGKSEVALAVARRIGAEVVSCDALAVYRGLTVLTAKAAAPPDVPHHLVDAVDPSETYSAARFAADADRLVGEIRARGRTPLVVGGTALYLKAWTMGLSPGVGRDARVRERLEALARDRGPEALHERLRALDPERAAALHGRDERRLVRALEIVETTGRPASAFRDRWDAPDRVPTAIVGLRRSREDLARRIDARVRAMAEAGLVAEARAFLARADVSPEAAQAIGLAEMREHLAARLSLKDALAGIARRTRRFARRQEAFFRRFASAVWVDAAPDAPPDALAAAAVAAYVRAGASA
jgi:tRNA dimethylallyltransferase